MTRFVITVDRIEDQEYFQACRLNALRLYKILAVSMIVLCGVIMLASNNFSVKAVAWPAGIFVACIIGWELLTRLSYKGQLRTVDPPVEYEFRSNKWIVTRNGETSEFDWKGTTALKKTKHCIFLYDNDASSSLLPRRLMNAEQEAALTGWFQASRQDAKAYQKKQLKKEREEYRESHPGLRLGRTGPAWGPFRRR